MPLFLQIWLQRLEALHAQHPRRLMAGVGAALALLAGGAYAVASVGESAFANSRSVTEVLGQIDVSGARDTSLTQLYRAEMSRSSDTVDSLLSRLGVSDSAAAGFLRSNDIAKKQLLGKAGRLVQVQTDGQQRLMRMTVRWLGSDNSDRFNRWVVQRQGDSFEQRMESAPLSVSTRLGSGVIESSLFAATDAANLPDSIAMQMADIFDGDIDFHRALRKGDRFSVAYEVLEADGEVLRTGRVLSAQFVNNGKTLQAFWFKAPNATEGGYYNAEGVSLKRTYLASPLAFSRVTSGFKMRFHPILQTWRAHLGVDYAAPTGPPVRSVGQGVVESSGWTNGYGNVVTLRHNNGISTVYAHLSRIDVRKGQSVAQGQTLGAVGATGWATGPHLHFEFRVNGQQRDPMTMARQSQSVPLAAAHKPQFLQYVQSARQELAAAGEIQATRTE